MSRPDRFEIARSLREVGILLPLTGGNPFKARAYLNGASALEGLSSDFDEMVKADRLTEIAGIGDALASNINELYKSGELQLLTRLKSELPPGVIELSEIPGLTVKRIRALSEALHITSVEELEQACLNHKIAAVKGFGPKLEETILESIRSHKLHSTKILLIDAFEIAEHLIRYLKAQASIDQIAYAGNLRRWHEVIEEIVIVASSAQQNKVLKAFSFYPRVTEILEKDNASCRVRLADGLTAQLNMVSDFAIGLLEKTGCEAHFQQLQSVAKDAGLSLKADGLFKKGKKIITPTEAEIYENLHLSFVPAELREGDGEIEQAASGEDSFADLITIDDIQGMTHCHTEYSDGTYTIEEMALAAEKLGMKYITITDHSPLASYAGGLSVERLKKQWDEMERVQEKVKIRLLKGTECDIQADGHLDYPDDILSQFDLIIASVHNRFKLDHKAMTARVLKAMKDRHFKVWGHPLGRLLLRRPPIDVDVEKILDVIADSKAAIEINGDPYRLDLEPLWVKAALARGIKIIISTDAHSIRDYRSLEYGVHMARRAGVRRHDVLNALPFSKFRSAVKPGK